MDVDLWSTITSCKSEKPSIYNLYDNTIYLISDHCMLISAQIWGIYQKLCSNQENKGIVSVGTWKQLLSLPIPNRETFNERREKQNVRNVRDIWTTSKHSVFADTKYQKCNYYFNNFKGYMSLLEVGLQEFLTNQFVENFCLDKKCWCIYLQTLRRNFSHKIGNRVSKQVMNINHPVLLSTYQENNDKGVT